jgi:septal ring factor EnvC (AmiA/AmiB activator)
LCFKQSDSEVGEAEQKLKKLNQDVLLIKQDELKVQQELRGQELEVATVQKSLLKVSEEITQADEAIRS